VLVGLEDLPGGSAPIADSEDTLPLDRLPSETVWLPDNRTVAFNTIMAVSYGHAPNDDLWLVDVESGIITQLLADDYGGRFAFSPDASHVVVCTHESVTMMDADGGNRRTLVIFDHVLTYSEYAYQPKPVWAPDGSHALVAISSRDPAEPDALATIWRLPLSGDALSLGTLPDRFLLNTGTDALWSAERTHIAYIVVAEDGEARTRQLVIAQADGSDPTVYAAGELDFLRWAWEGTEFAYWHNVASEIYRGGVGQSPVQLLGPGGENTAVVSVGWFGQDNLVYVVAEAGQFTIWSGPIDGEHRVIGRAAGYTPDIDIWE
jgi:dipeptidyl aminopeptidase/acylaminoacyl peptidase